ncbi:MAG: hypothetical protein WC586_12980 [Methanoregula sp.]
MYEIIMKTFHGIILAGIVCVMLMAAGCTSSAPATTTTPVVTTAAPAPSLLTGTPAVTPAPEALPWSGTWNSSWLESNGNQTPSVLSLVQTGSKISGTYHYSYPDGASYNGSLNATVRGDSIAGTYSETDNDTGLFIFKLSEDQHTFTGRWVHAVNESELSNSTLTWNGIRQ